MNSSVNQRSILLDNGEYYYDDDFAVPFDANLKPDDSQTSDAAAEEGGGSLLTESAFLDGRPVDESSMDISEFPNDPLFSPEQSMIASGTSLLSSFLAQAGMDASAMDQKTRHILNTSYIHDNYQLIYHSRPLHRQGQPHHGKNSAGLNTWASKAAHKRIGAAVNEQISSEQCEMDSKPTHSSTLLSAYAANKGIQLTASPRQTDFEVLLDSRSLRRIGSREALYFHHAPQTVAHPVSGGGNQPMRKTCSFSNLSRSSTYGSRSHLGGTVMDLPKSNRLEEQAFLSAKTLPDLSFLASATATPEHNPRTRRRGASVTRSKSSKRSGAAATNSNGEDANHLSVSISFSEKMGRNRRLSEPHVDKNLGDSVDVSLHEVENVPNRPSLGHQRVLLNKCCSENRICGTSSPGGTGGGSVAAGSGDSTPLKSCLRRNSSGRGETPIGILQEGGFSTPPLMESLSSSGGAYDTNELREWLQMDETLAEARVSPTEMYGDSPIHGCKKSVSFSDRIHLLALQESAADDMLMMPIPGGPGHQPLYTADLTERSIPRNVGLYGADPFIAAFPLDSECVSVPLAQVQGLDKSTFATELTDTRLFALANDVVLAVNRLHEVHSHVSSRVHSCDSQMGVVGESTFLPVAQTGTNSPGSRKRPSSAMTSLLQQVALQLAIALHRLLSDGLLVSSAKTGAALKSAGIWNLVEESCKPGCTHRTAIQALLEVKSHRPQLVSEKSKFAAFVFTCLNIKCLALWFEGLHNNENFLRRFYYDDGFLRMASRQVHQAQQSENSNAPNLAPLFMELLQSLHSLPLIAFDLHLTTPAPSKGSTSSTASGGARQTSGGDVNSPNATRRRATSRTASSRLPPSLAHKFRAGALVPGPTSMAANKLTAFSNNTADYRYLKPNRSRTGLGNTTAKDGGNGPLVSGTTIRRSQSARVMPSHRSNPGHPLAAATAASGTDGSPLHQASRHQLVRTSWEKRAAATSLKAPLS